MISKAICIIVNGKEKVIHFCFVTVYYHFINLCPTPPPQKNINQKYNYKKILFLNLKFILNLNFLCRFVKYFSVLALIYHFSFFEKELLRLSLKIRGVILDCFTWTLLAHSNQVHFIV